jgi:MFS family permease
MIRNNATTAARFARSLRTAEKLLLQKECVHLSKPAFASGIRSYSSKNGLNQASLSPTPEPLSEKKGWFDRIFGKEASVAPETFTNRWAMAIPAFLTHVSLGAPYAWSLMADLVTREQGFVASAASDWTLMQAALPLSLVFVVHGMAASTLGAWQAKVGPKKCLLYSSMAFGGGMIGGALGVYFHSLPLLYTGYGVLAGIGLGLAYTPPIQTLISWFPDKKALASSIAIAGFGTGPLVFTPAAQYLTKKFAKMPTYLGTAQDFVTKTIDGRLFAEVNGALVEVVNAGATELGKLPYQLSEGLYVVGSGSSGVAEALGVMGLTYFTTILLSSFLIRNPHPTVMAKLTADAAIAHAPSKAATTTAAPPVLKRDAEVSEVMRTPQFYLLGTTFFCVAIGGMGFFSIAKPMMSELFGAAMPAVVTSAFAASYVQMISVGNLGGRLGWAAISDKIGRRETFMIFTAGSIPLYLACPTLVEQAVTTGSVIPLYLFCGASMAVISGMGAAFAILPAYQSDLFGTKNVGAIHGRMLAFSSFASIVGPSLILKLRSIAEEKAILELLSKISPAHFETTFGAPMERASELVAAKTINIGKLLALCPPGTLDPTPHLYDIPMYTLSALAATAFLAHYMVKPYTPPANVIDVAAKEEKPMSN